MRALAVSISVVATCLPLYVMADPPAQEAARAKYAEGKKQFNAERYDAAADLFKEAYDLYPDPAYLFNMAIAYEHKRRWRLAVQYFDRFMEAAPDSPATSEVQARRAAAQKAREAEMATVNVRTDPAGATAEVTSVSGTSRCQTPCTVMVDPGPVSVSASLEGRTGDSARRLGANDVWNVTVPWIRAPQGTGRLVVNVDTPGAVVRVGGKRVPAGEALSLVTGRYEVIVSHADHPEHRQMVEVVEGRPVEVNVALGGARGDPDRAQRIAGYSTLGVGGAMLVNAIVFAALANADYDTASDIVQSDQRDRAGELSELRSSVERKSLVADVSFGIAAAGVVTGLVLWLTADDAPSSTASAEGHRWSVLRF